MKYLLLSDTLYSINSRIDQERWYPPFLKAFSLIDRIFHKQTADVILKWFDRRSQKSLVKLLTRADWERIDGIIGVGNYTIGTNESGMITPECEDQFQRFWALIKKHLLRWNSLLKMIFAPGNHDLGYRYKVHVVKVGSETGSPSAKSVEAFERLFGNLLFGLADLGVCDVLYVSSVLMRNRRSKDEVVFTKAMQQDEFVLHVLGNRKKDKPLFFVIHDPKALQFSSAITEALQTNREKIAAIIHGHMHSTLLQKIVWLCSGNYRKLCKDFEVILARDPSGFFGIGGGCTFLTVEGSSWTVKNMKA